MRLVCAAAMLALLPAPALAGLQFGVVTPNQKVRPSDQPPLAPSANLRAGRNEFEAFQIVFLGSGGTAKQVSVRLASPLVGPAGAGIPDKNVVLYRVGYYNVGSPSSGEGAAGPWPDPLIPDVDTYFGEKRNAFPFDVPDGQSRVVWVDVLVPQNAQPGIYKGSLEVSLAGGKVGEVPIRLEVGGFTLPSTASLASDFGMAWAAPCQAHFGNSNCGPDWNPERAEQLRHLYVRSALEHRFTIGDSYYQPPKGSLASFENYVLPMLAGSASTRLPGAKLTSINIGGDLAYWVAYSRSKGFFERTIFYPVDEPGSNSSQWNELISAAGALHAVDPLARIIITASIQEANAAGATSSVDIFCPVINYLEDKAAWSRYKGDQCGAYSAWLAGGQGNRQLWAYQSCMSHGCGGCGAITTDSYWNGWPSRVIDSSAVQNRAFPWIAFRHNLAGELYFDVTNQLSTAWNSNGQCKYGGQGDGTIFYPGRPSVIGGNQDIPIESIRVKMIREGMEDYEYLLLARTKDAARTEAIADALFPSTFDCAQPAAKLEQARDQLFQMLSPPLPPTGDGTTTGASGEGEGPAASEASVPLGGGDGGNGIRRSLAGEPTVLDGGCGCRIPWPAPRPGPEAAAVSLLLALLLVLSRRGGAGELAAFRASGRRDGREPPRPSPRFRRGSRRSPTTWRRRRCDGASRKRAPG